MDLALATLVMTCGFLMGCTPMWNFDIWMHLRTGQLILEQGGVPQSDWYSFTDPDQRWISIHWLFQIVVAKLYSWGGVNLLLVVKAAAQMVTVLVCWLAVGRSVPTWFKASCMLLLVVCLSGRSVVRPDMVTNVLLAVSLFIAHRSQTRAKLIWLWPVVQVIWTNCHGLFVLGMVVGGAYLADRLVRHVARGRWGFEPPPDQPNLRSVAAVAGCTLLACFLNPYFVEGALFPLELFGKLGNDPSEEHLSAMQVFQRTGFKVHLIIELILWCLTVASFIGLACCRRISVMRLLLFIGFSYLGWIAARNIAIFGIIASVICCLNVADILSLKRKAASPETSEIVTTLPYLVGIVSVALAVSVVTSSWHHFTGRDHFGFGELKDWYIHDAAKFADQPGMPSRALIIGYGQAAVFVFHNSPERKIFLDGRLEMYRDQTIEQYFQVCDDIARRHPEFMSPLLDKDQQLPTIIVANSSSTRDLLASLMTCPNVRLVFADATAGVFLQQSTAEKLQLPVADPRPLNLTFESAADYFRSPG